jgi:hypothetical protein
MGSYAKQPGQVGSSELAGFSMAVRAAEVGEARSSAQFPELGFLLLDDAAGIAYSSSAACRRLRTAAIVLRAVTIERIRA